MSRMSAMCGISIAAEPPTIIAMINAGNDINLWRLCHT
ncbi:unnamed protein product [Acidithrix sp. C25]|nr:unnamed protein product [Acidithrix sp. C25]